MATVLGFDSSFDELKREEARTFKNAGYEIFWQACSALTASGLVQPSTRVTSLRNATDEGLVVAGYALIGEPGRSVPQQLDVAFDGIPDELLQLLTFMAVDVEVSGITIDQINEALDYCRMRMPWGWPTVYSSVNAWRNKIGDPPRRPGTYLIDANWDFTPDVTFPRLYGGFLTSDVLGKQFKGGGLQFGQNVDLDVFDDRLLRRFDQPEPLPDGLPEAARIAESLSVYYPAMGRSMPSMVLRGEIYQALGLGASSLYGGTVEQNVALLRVLKQLAIAPRSVSEIGQ